MTEEPEFWTQPEGGERIPMERDPDGNLIGPPGVSHVYVGTSTLTVTDFILARIAEDEEAARAAAKDQSHRDSDGMRWLHSVSGSVYLAEGGYVACGPWETDLHVTGAHIARHDPARVLAQCAAMRKIVGLETSDPSGYFDGFWDAKETALRALASIWSDHPDWREEWRP